MEEIDFYSDQYEDIIAKDPRYNARAYALLIEVFNCVSMDGSSHASGEDILDEFKYYTRDQYGPMSYTVLTEWGITCTEDIGEMMFNLAESGRINKDENDTPESFANGYDFKEAFLGPYQA